MTESLPVAVHPDHLTESFLRSGLLGSGRVRNVVVESSRNTILPRIVRLHLTYDGTADDAPKSVILKTGLPDRASSGRQEVAFYTQVVEAMRTRMVPRCYEAHWDAKQNAWHLLLEDLTDTHVVATVWPLPPSVEQCQAIMRARARFHAAWWDDARLGTTVGVWSDDDAIDRYLQRLAEAVKHFLDRLGDRLPRERRELYDRLLASAPRLSARHRSHHNLTIVQGDAHVWNCFLPKTGGDDDVRFFDWDCWRIDTGSDDLAYMMAMHWYPDHRRILEQPLLDLYHATLVAHGIAYDRQALDADYRLSVLWQITTPVWQAGNNLPPVIWWNNLERILLAVDDLGCRNLLT